MATSRHINARLNAFRPTSDFVREEAENEIRVYNDEVYPEPELRHQRIEEEEEEERGDDHLSDVLLQEFRHDVNTWMEVDNKIRQLQVMLKDRRAFKTRLTEKIMRVMKRYDLKSLDMGDAGVIQSRKSQVKTPISQKAIRNGINTYFENINNVTLGMQLVDTVFNNRERVERTSLRRSSLVPPPQQLMLGGRR